MEIALERTPLLCFLPLRLACGYLLAAAGLGKVLSGWLRSPLLAVRIGEWLQAGHMPRLIAPVLERLLLHMQHHAQSYSILIASAELLCGAALLVGLFSRYAAMGGFLLTLLPLLAAGEQLGPSPDVVACAAFASLSLVGSGRALGLDGLLRGRVPGWLS